MTITNNVVNRSVVLTDYIPLQVRTEKECREVEYCSFRKSDTSLLELAFDQTDQLVHRITLLLCADYRQTAEEYQLPADCVKGDLLMDSSTDIDTAVFSCVIYSNAVRITVSDLPVCKSVLADNIVWGLSEHSELVSLCLIDETGKASEHCNLELSSNQ
ncbi:MAG: hypothetical protein IJ221_08295 [Oscillibacter sp.]|nr:hypothetical protein [Oscillibacter sp.]